MQARLQRPCPLNDCLYHYLDRMFRQAAGPVENLLSAGDPRRDDVYLSPGFLDRWEQPLPADSNREIVVFFLESEGSGHPTTACVDLFNDETGDQLQRLDRRAGPDQCLLMAVPMEQNASLEGAKGERKVTALIPIEEELFEEKALARHRLGLGTLHQVTPLIPDGQETTGLTSHDGNPSLHEPMQLIDRCFGALHRLFEEPF